MTTDVKVDAPEDLVARYAQRIRTDAIPGRETDFAALVIDALTDQASRHSNAKRLQRVHAVVAAAQQVADERRQARLRPVNSTPDN